MRRTAALFLLLSCGCSAPRAGAYPPAAARDTAGLRLQAAARVAAPARGVPPGAASLWVDAALTNATADSLRLEYGACALGVRGYRTAERTAPPAWDARLRAPYEGGYGYMCQGYAVFATLRPGQTLRARELSGRYSVAELLGDSLPDGRYHLTVSLDVRGAPVAEVHAGAVHLSFPGRPPLPASRVARLVAYRAEARVLPGGGVRAEVTATLSGGQGALVRYPADCPVTLHAYRDRARRDAAPRSGPADWSGPARRCGPGEQRLRMERGEPHTFVVEASSAEILGTRLPPGRYFLAVRVQGEGVRTWLSAGDAVLRR
jgi:hypothetical protein